ncbi:hypothetical protein DT076_11275 [Desertihabitans brevis]|uniref:F420-dependent oxidoreductase n=1 Tax=Desertihabitans brevis TaxID=2268447 RepID=A0A367YUB8_9ACTN|nr:hypothetical protein DT076_11275 [Desertihabitans brevis]
MLGVTGGVAAVALLVQLALVLSGQATLLPDGTPPPTWLALVRLVSYFTIQSNTLVAVGCLWLALGGRVPAGRAGRVLRWVRLASLMGITLTGVVHWFLLRPLLDLDGARALVDALLHIVVPLLAVLGWLLVGPRSQTSVPLAGAVLLWPVLWTVATLAVGLTTAWYPYPFLDVQRNGGGTVAVACLGITVAFLVVLALVVLVDRRLPAPLEGVTPSARSAAPPPARRRG